MNNSNNVISRKKSEIMSITKDFRRMIRIYGFRYKKSTLKHLRFSLRSHEKIVNDEKEDDIEYLQERIDYMRKLFKTYIKQNQYHDQNTKYNGVETIKYLFENNDEDYNLYLINNQQYQLFSDKTLLKLDEYLKKIRSHLTKFMINCKVNLNFNAVFRSTENSNDKRTLYMKSEEANDIDEIFD